MFGPFALQWTSPKLPPSPPPSPITRKFVPTPSGNIELLYAAPSSPSTQSRTPMFFVHGGFGSAAVWHEFMIYLSQQHNIPCYSVSMRGRGASWNPGYLRLVYLTTFGMLTDDVVRAIQYVQEKEGEEVVLVGHSSGGGMVQSILDRGLVKVKGLVLAGAIPGYGSLGVYQNWWSMDKVFSLRMIWHGWHPKSPLSTTALVKRAFFSDAFPDSKVEAFKPLTAPFESFLWPLAMFSKFANPVNVLRSITGWGSNANRGDRVLLLAGEKDRLVSLDLNEKSAGFYRKAFEVGVEEKKIEAKEEPVEELRDGESSGLGVRLAVVKGAGHHLQNDLQWEDGAEKLFEFYEQL